ncbi:MAG: hypothetical protein WA326_01350, partial [Nitrososphaeraceae archaeon]
MTNRHITDNNNNDNNTSKIEKEFFDVLSEFIHSVESEIDIMLPGSESLRFLSHYKIIDSMISQKLNKNIIIKMLCPLDEKSVRLMKQLAPFIGYKSIKLSLPKASANSSFFIGDKQAIFSFSIDTQKQQHDKENRENTTSNAIFSIDEWSNSKNVSIVGNAGYCFDLIWEEKENYDSVVKENNHSDLLFDV